MPTKFRKVIITGALVVTLFTVSIVNAQSITPLSKSPTETTEAFIVEVDKLSYEEAVQKAIEESYALKKLEKDKVIAEEGREIIRSTVSTTRPKPNVEDYDGGWSEVFITDAANKQALLSVMQADIGLKSYEYNKQIQAEAIRYQVKALFNSITNTKEQIELANLALENSQRQLSIISQKFQLGLESEYNRSMAEKQLEQQRKQMEQLKKTLDNSYIQLNRLIGEEETNRSELEYKITFNPIEEKDLEGYINKKLNKDPYLKIQEQSVISARYALQLYSDRVTDTYQSRRSQLDKAEYNASDSKQAMEESLRTTYNQILQLEEQYQSNQLDFEKAQEQLKVVQTQYELGMIIEADLKQAEIAVAQAQFTLDSTAMQHDQLIFLFNRPYLL